MTSVYSKLSWLNNKKVKLLACLCVCFSLLYISVHTHTNTTGNNHLLQLMSLEYFHKKSVNRGFFGQFLFVQCASSQTQIKFSLGLCVCEIVRVRRKEWDGLSCVGAEFIKTLLVSLGSNKCASSSYFLFCDRTSVMYEFT